jgi:polynucleotide 5'-kinase involved in rRNA processing
MSGVAFETTDDGQNTTDSHSLPRYLNSQLSNAWAYCDYRLPEDAILVMGLTGSGKSTFISLLADEMVQVGHDMSSCKLITPYD